MQIACLPGGILDANTYILQADDSRQAVVIDPTDADRLARYCAAHRLTPAAILLTHGHFDHICGLADCLQRWQIPVYLHPGDGSMLADPLHNGLHLFFADAPFAPIEGAIPLSHEQILEIADLSIRVLATPGHSPGSVCYLIEGNLFSGDTLFHGGLGRTDLWGGDYNAMFASIRSLRPLPRETAVYPGHGSATTLFAELRN